MKKVLLIGMAATLLILGCRKDNITNEVDYVTENGEPIDTRLTGQVIDENGLPIEEASVSIGNEVLVTNEDGIFSFPKISINSDGSLAVIEKNGFYTNFKRVLPSENKTFIKFGLTPKINPTGRFMATEGGTISRQGKEKITFVPNSIVDKSGTLYNGEVTVFSDYFNIDKPYLGELMPGDLTGLNTEGAKVQLKTYSMVAAELFGENGEGLNLKEGTTANIEFPLSQQTSSPPQKIALWSLDENTGLWLEEGSATYDGNVYQGEVSHFSFWNCDAPFPLINLFGTIGDFDGNLLPHFKINIQTEDSGLVRSGYTNSSGLFHGKVPANELLLIQLLDNCESVIYEEKIGPFSETTVLPLIKVEIIENSIQITGKVQGCNGEVVSQGLITVRDNQGRISVFTAEPDGSFEVPFINCGTNNFEVTGTDLVTLLKSPAKPVENNGQDFEDIGTLIACDMLGEFFKIEIQGQENYLAGINVIISPFSSRIRTDPFTSQEQEIDISFEPFTAIGNATPTEITYTDINRSSSVGCSGSGFLSCDPHFSFELTRTDDFIGGYWEGEGTGELFIDSQLTPVNISFRVPVSQVMSRVRGNLWLDTNKNGLQDSGEPPFTDAIISVDFINNFNQLVSYQTAANNDGSYSIQTEGSLFDISIQGVPNDYSFTQMDVGTDDTIDSDFDPVTMSIKDLQLYPIRILYMDAGFIEN